MGSLLIIASSLITEKGINLMLPIVAYESLFQGATGISFIDVAGRAITFNPSINPDQAERAITNTLAAASPLVLTGLAVGVGFKAGLFNIGGPGSGPRGRVRRRDRSAAWSPINRRRSRSRLP